LEHEGRELVRVRGEARTAKWLDWIWKMRDTIESVVDPSTGKPETYLFVQKENSARIRTELDFRWEDNLVLGTRTKNGRAREHVFPVTEAYDPISAAFLLRTLPIDVGQTKVVEVLSG